MGVHGLPRHICPYCLKRFETRQGVKAHQKSTRHRVSDQREGAEQERALRHHDHERRDQIKRERMAAANPVLRGE